MPVDYVAVVGAPAGELFHFTLALVSKATNESVSIDMKPQVESMLGVATVEYNDYEYSRHYGPAPFIIRVPSGTTVAMILKIIFGNGAACSFGKFHAFLQPSFIYATFARYLRVAGRCLHGSRQVWDRLDRKGSRLALAFVLCLLLSYFVLHYLIMIHPVIEREVLFVC